ncbi:MAG: hypothetical protein AABW79_03450 [Nanoarchaeota archaeon]
MKIFYTLILSLALIVVAFFSYSVIKDSSFNLNSISNILSQKNTETKNENNPSVSSGGSSGGSSGASGSGISGQVVNPIPPESEPNIYYEPHYCAPESRDVECDESQGVVCGWFTQQQGSCNGPCVKIFVNTCQACEDDRVEYWTNGDCPIHG